MTTTQTPKLDTSATAASLGALLFWSVGPIFIKFLTGHLDLWTQNLLRYLAASLLWLPFLLYTCYRKQLDNRVWRRAVLPATANIIMQCFWAGAFYYINPAFMILLSKSSIIWIVAFSLIFFSDERTLVKSSRFWFGLGLCLIGVIGVTLCKKDFTASKTTTGIIIALVASLMWGVYTVLVKISFKDIDSRSGFSVTSIYTIVGLCVLAFMFGKPQDCLSIGAWPWACVVISGILSIAFTHVLYYSAIRRIGATIPSLILLSTPFTVFAISSVVFDESLNGFQWLFGIVLLCGSGLSIWAQGHLRRKT